MMDFFNTAGFDSPSLNHAVASLKMDFNDLNLEFDCNPPREESRLDRVLSNRGKVASDEDFSILGSPKPDSALPKESRLRKILSVSDPEVFSTPVRGQCPSKHGVVSPPDRNGEFGDARKAKSAHPPKLDPTCLESIFEAQGIIQPPSTPSTSTTVADTPTEQTTSTPAAASPAGKTYVVPAPAIHVSQLRNMQQQNRQAFPSTNHKPKGGHHKRNTPTAKAFTPNTQAPAPLPIILLDPVTGQPVGAVQPMQPGVGMSGTIMGLVPQGEGRAPANMAFVPVPIPAAAMNSLQSISPHMHRGGPPLQSPSQGMHNPSPMQGPHHQGMPNPMQGMPGMPHPFPNGMAPQMMPGMAPAMMSPMGPMGHPMAPHQHSFGMAPPGCNPTVGPQQPQEPQPPQPALSPVKPREKTILKIINPESGQEVTPETTERGAM